MKLHQFLILFFSLSLSSVNLSADTVEARCDIYPKGSDKLDKMLPCYFSQRQGYVHIIRKDGIEYSLTPYGEDPGNYRDDQGRAVYRQSGLGKEGVIFRLPEESVFVYWDTSALNPPHGKDNPTYPFSTKDFAATSLFRCKTAADAEETYCAAGIRRLAAAEADIHVKLPSEEIAIFEFRGKHVTAAGHAVSWQMDGDTWQLVVDGSVNIEVPSAAIEGG